MRSIWTAVYEGSEIRIENTWFEGEKLFVNNELQDERISFSSSNMTGYVKAGNGERLDIKVNVSGFLKISCRLFVDHRKVEVTQLK